MVGTTTGNDVWARRASLVWRRVGDEAVILDPEGKVLRGFNLTAWRVWELLDGNRSIDQVASSFAHENGIDLQRARGDVDAFIQVLSGARLVEKVR